MGEIKKPLPVMYFVAITWNSKTDPKAALEEFSALLSPVSHKTEILNFDFTDYYLPEMGEKLLKQFFAFSKPDDVERLPELKIASNKIEEQYLTQGNRQINLDPGYLTAAKIVLATTKNYSHRLYLARGIFGDLHMQYQKGNYQPNPWTYPDYKQPEVLVFFKEMRENLMVQLAAAAK